MVSGRFYTVKLFSIRYCYIQTKENRKRIRKQGKNLKESKLPIEERAKYLLENGRLIDYTHPREIDKYLMDLYKLFEYINLYERVFIHELWRCIELYNRPVRKEDLIIFYTILKKFKGIKRKSIQYMLNGITPIMGSVVKNKFWGQRRYWKDLFSLFTETFLENINKMYYDVDKTRMSVYVYQLFWLAGLTYIKKVKTEEEKYTSFPEYYYEKEERGLLMLSTQNQDDFEKEDVEIDNYEEVEEDNISETEYEGESDFEDEYSNYSDSIYKTNKYERDVDRELDYEKVKLILSKILIKLNISINDLYGFNNEKKILQLGRKIRKLLKQGKIELTESERRILEEYVEHYL